MTKPMSAMVHNKISGTPEEVGVRFKAGMQATPSARRYRRVQTGQRGCGPLVKRSLAAKHDVMRSVRGAGRYKFSSKILRLSRGNR